MELKSLSYVKQVRFMLQDTVQNKFYGLFLLGLSWFIWLSKNEYLFNTTINNIYIYIFLTIITSHLTKNRGIIHEHFIYIFFLSEKFNLLC